MEFSTIERGLAEGRAALRETNDCTVRAVSVATGVDYLTAHAAIKARGRKDRQGAYDRQYMGAVNDLGFHYVDVTGHFQDVAKTAKTLARHLPADQNFIVVVSGHAAGWTSGKFVDFIAGRRHRIRRVYHVARNRADLMPEKKWDYRHAKQGTMPNATFVYHCQNRRSGNWEYRIMLRENDRVRWINTAYYEDEALEMAERAAAKRGYNWINETVADLDWPKTQEGERAYYWG